MPNRIKKDLKSKHPSGGSHWQNFHFSGKLIVCSVIFGLMLILVGGIVLAIGMDRDEDTKSDDYEDIQKKPPMAIVGPVIMGIGGFTVVVGVFMCLVETNICRRRNVENSPLIEEEDRPKDSAATGIESDPTAIPSTSHKHRNGNHRKSPSPRKSRLTTKKPYSTKGRNPDATSPRSPPSAPINVSGHSSKSFLSASDKFLTPPSSFSHEVKPNSRDAENQTSSSLMKSFTSSDNSWIVSTEFQTPNASSIENSTSLESNLIKERLHEILDPSTSIINSHEFLTPKNSTAEMMISSVQDVEMKTENTSENKISSSTIGNNCSISNVTVETHYEEIKKQQASNSDALAITSFEKDDKSELENQVNSNESSTKELITTKDSINEIEGDTTSSIEVDENTPNTSINAEKREIDTEQNEGVPLNLVTESDSKDNNLVKNEIDQKCNLTEISKTFADEDKDETCNVKEVALKESGNNISTPEGGDFSASQSNVINANQENASVEKNLESEQKIIEDESISDRNNSQENSH